VTLNFLKGRLEKPAADTLETIDMGGGSLQVCARALAGC
jgi:hypothetical protein